MKQYEILYSDRHTEVVDHTTMEDLVYELEAFERDDVSQIHELNDDGSLGDTIWTEEEGLFTSYGELSGESDEEDDEEYYSDGSELFHDDTVPGVIENLLLNIDYTEDEEELRVYSKMKELKDDPEVIKELTELCVQKVCDSEKISNYLSDFTVSELEDMDSLWNLFGEILDDTIYEYFKG